MSEKRRILNVTEEPTQGSREEGLSYSTQRSSVGTAQGFQSSLQNSKAMLSVRVSDGWTSAKALERVPIAGLNVALDIGTKVLSDWVIFYLSSVTHPC